ncbi:unnamed protein product [Ceutorhynchus assimilis]|uniref:MICOS complex subunit MIC13 n=1 Tax=Ceutorhynchus assimilis TaxID=467358 RepID=A0A9N9MWP6_9CUCU|nr:unnamed protein product [Ceutorhynchus assimilis]
MISAMKFTPKTIKSFAIKAGIAASAVYYIKEQGIWKDSDAAIATGNRLKATLNPYVEEIKAQIPVELPHVPETENIGQLLQEYWNCGVRSAFQFLIKVPDYSREYTKKGVDALMGNEEIKNFVGSFSGGEQPKTVAK